MTSEENAEFDRKVMVIETALYRLKDERISIADPAHIRTVDDVLAMPAQTKVDLFDLIQVQDRITDL